MASATIAVDLLADLASQGPHLLFASNTAHLEEARIVAEALVRLAQVLRMNAIASLDLYVRPHDQIESSQTQD